jgi:hypothetical protein
MRHAGVGALVLGLFLTATCQLSAQLPPSDGAPKVGEKAPDFTLPDSDGNSFSLSGFLSRMEGREAALGRPQFLLLIFYRGYW